MKRGRKRERERASEKEIKKERERGRERERERERQKGGGEYRPKLPIWTRITRMPSSSSLSFSPLAILLLSASSLVRTACKTAMGVEK
jgi:hypothetical protein